MGIQGAMEKAEDFVRQYAVPVQLQHFFYIGGGFFDVSGELSVSLLHGNDDLVIFDRNIND